MNLEDLGRAVEERRVECPAIELVRRQSNGEHLTQHEFADALVHNNIVSDCPCHGADTIPDPALEALRGILFMPDTCFLHDPDFPESGKAGMSCLCGQHSLRTVFWTEAGEGALAGRLGDEVTRIKDSLPNRMSHKDRAFDTDFERWFAWENARKACAKFNDQAALDAVTEAIRRM